VAEPRNLIVNVKVCTERPEAVAALIEWARARCESARDDELIAEAVEAIDFYVGGSARPVPVVDDGSGLVEGCTDPRCDLEVVRPGSVQCSNFCGRSSRPSTTGEAGE
jgi:hypothetical protein